MRGALHEQSRAGALLSRGHAGGGGARPGRAGAVGPGGLVVGGDFGERSGGWVFLGPGHSGGAEDPRPRVHTDRRSICEGRPERP
eukprot:8487953-Pyramimonas_sp.AAC.1